jgi:hypothetical protein
MSILSHLLTELWFKMVLLKLIVLSLIAAVSCNFTMPREMRKAIPIKPNPSIVAAVKKNRPELFYSKGKEIEPSTRIIGGENAVMGQFPHYALLSIYTSDGGVSLNDGLFETLRDLNRLHIALHVRRFLDPTQLDTDGSALLGHEVQQNNN